LEEASNLIKQALVMEPAERTHLLMLARIAAEQGAYWMAWEHLREALISDAQDIEVLHLAMEVLSQGQLQGLFQGLSRHLTENASHTALAQAVELRHLLLTQPEVLSTEVRRRMRQLGQAIGQCTDWSELRLLHLYQQRKDSQGLAFLRQAASQADASLQMRLLALRWAGKLGDTPWVVQLAFRLERDFADDRLVMEQVLLHGHDSPAWPQWASLAQAQWSKDVRILYSLSMGALARGEAESALDHALACVALQPNHLGAWLVAAKAAKALGRFDDAQRHVRSAWSSPAMAWSPFIAVECALLMADISGQEGGKGANIEWLELAARISASAAEHDPARAMHYRSLALAGLGDSAGAATALANAQRHGWRDGSLW
jgi:tetratricopeptide (TPR) repeat protein